MAHKTAATNSVIGALCMTMHDERPRGILKFRRHDTQLLSQAATNVHLLTYYGVIILCLFMCCMTELCQLLYCIVVQANNLLRQPLRMK